MEVEKIMQGLERKHPGELEFLQAVREVLESIKDVYNQHPEFEKAKIVERIVEPERIITFRVPWVDDKGEVPLRQPLYPEVPGIRTDIQECTYHAAYGRWQGRFRLCPSWQERR